MFSIQYQAVTGEHKMQTFDSKDRQQLVRHLSHFERPIMAVYQNMVVITKAVRDELSKFPPSQLSGAARNFVSSPL